MIMIMIIIKIIISIIILLLIIIKEMMITMHKNLRFSEEEPEIKVQIPFSSFSLEPFQLHFEKKKIMSCSYLHFILF